MSGSWVEIPVGEKLYLNLDEAELTRAQAALENVFITEASGQRRMYGIANWITLPDGGRVHGLHDDGFENLIAVTDRGNTYRIDKSGNAEDVTGVPVQGPGRPIFSKTTDGLMIAAGRAIVRLGEDKTDILSEDAPDATHVQFIDNFLLANDEGRFNHCTAGVYTQWDALDVFAANSSPDPITAMLVTPFREILMCGPQSIEQYERLASGDAPFFRRWTVGEGISAPYALLHADNATFLVNDKREVVRASGQTSQPISIDIGAVLEAPGIDWTGAWIGGFPDQPLHFDGQKFILLQLPNAVTPYDNKGLTFVYDYRQQKWFSLYGWDAELGIPARWPGWCHWSLWGEVFVGGDDGKIGKMSKTVHTNFGVTQRALARTAHLSEQGEITVDDVRVRMKRGVGDNTTDPVFSLRVRRGNRDWGRWQRKSLGKAGNRNMTLHFGRQGMGHVFQFEWEVSDDCEVEVHKMQAQVSPVGY